MATLTVWKFPTSNGAESALAKLDALSRQQLIAVYDAALVTWPEGRKKPKTRELHDMKGAGALGGAFWGLLFGLIFFVPVIGMAVGAAAGAMMGSLAHYGIDEGFISSVREKVVPGTSALFLMSGEAVQERVREAFSGTPMELLATNLTPEQEEQLRESFGIEEPVSADKASPV